VDLSKETSMSDFSKHLAHGVLALALSSPVLACGDDDQPDVGSDCGCGDRDGSSAGRGGRGGTGSGGDGGSGGAGSDAGSMDVSEAECLATTASNAGGTVSDACATCLCRDSANDTAACTADCWALRTCFARHCPGLMQGTSEGSTCAVGNCMELLGGAIYATPLEMIIASECPDVCAPADADGGADDGGS
jgi:hypothetical protein